MKIQDILFLPYFLLLFSDLKEIHIFYINCLFFLIQMMLSFKYKFDKIRWKIIGLIIAGSLIHLFAELYTLGISSALIILALLGIILYLSAFITYVNSFIIKKSLNK